MNVLQVYKTRYPELAGGVDVVVANLLRSTEPGFNVALLRTAEWTMRGIDDQIVDDARMFSLHLPLPPAKPRDFRGWLFFARKAPVCLMRLSKLLARNDFDLVHLHTLQNYHLYFVLAPILGGPPFVITLHRAEVLGFPTRARPTRILWKLSLRRAVAVNAVSEWLAGEARAAFPFLRNIDCITSGIDIGVETLPVGRDVRERLSLPERYCVAIGTLAPYKGHDIAIRAWRELDPEYDDLHLVIVGSGALLHAHRDLAQALGISGRVHFTGQLGRADALAVARDSLAMVMASRNEGQGLAVLEAGAVSTAIICSDIGPFREMVEHRETGLLFESEDHHALATAVQSLASDRKLREGVARRFSQQVRSRYSLAEMFARYAAFYRKALDRRPAERPAHRVR